MWWDHVGAEQKLPDDEEAFPIMKKMMDEDVHLFLRRKLQCS